MRALVTYSRGQKVGNLIYLNEENRNDPKVREAKFLCPCGNEFITIVRNVKNLHTKSCGCLHEIYGKTKDGKKTTEYTIYYNMKTRCYNRNHESYPRYGGRGIKICDRWLNSFANFLLDMGKRPSKYYSIERINNDGNYEPSNCRWATSKEQMRNMSRNVNVIFNGKTMCLGDLSKETGISRTTLVKRLKKTGSVDVAVFHKKGSRLANFISNKSTNPDAKPF